MSVGHVFISQGHPGSLRAGKKYAECLLWHLLDRKQILSLFFPVFFSLLLSVKNPLDVCAWMLHSTQWSRFRHRRILHLSQCLQHRLDFSANKFHIRALKDIYFFLCRLSPPVSVTLFLLPSLYICQPTTLSFVSRLHTSSLSYLTEIVLAAGQGERYIRFSTFSFHSSSHFYSPVSDKKKEFERNAAMSSWLSDSMKWSYYLKWQPICNPYQPHKVFFSL